jgi:hypothetical protein
MTVRYGIIEYFGETSTYGKVLYIRQVDMIRIPVHLRAA